MKQNVFFNLIWRVNINKLLIIAIITLCYYCSVVMCHCFQFCRHKKQILFVIYNYINTLCINLRHICLWQ